MRRRRFAAGERRKHTNKMRLAAGERRKHIVKMKNVARNAAKHREIEDLRHFGFLQKS